MCLPLISLVLIVAIFPKNVAYSFPVNTSNTQYPQTGRCKKLPVNNCNCRCSLTQNPHLSDAVKRLERKLENLTQNLHFSGALKRLERKFEKMSQNLHFNDAVKKLERKLKNLTQNSHLRDAVEGLERKLENLISHVNKTASPVPQHIQPAGAIISSCKEQYEKDNSSRSQVYTLTFGSQKVPVFCHMGNFGCGDGGWTMAIKTDGTKRTFHFDSHLWSDSNAYNLAGGQTGFDTREAKLPTYWATAFSKICLGMKNGHQFQFIVINRHANSLLSLIFDGKYRSTSLGRITWKNLMGSQASLQNECNREGFNAACTQVHSPSRARIGILSNNQNDCVSCDSKLGFGMSGDPDDANTCGNAARNYADNGPIYKETFGYILVQ